MIPGVAWRAAGEIRGRDARRNRDTLASAE